ncbi:MAG: hypothetical protein B7Y90_14605 [Alphaproteobacteria bacterium 32-64-14]|nr:MAG: hypothetical protein B7Y90_14605 [Alphaproteobacteria bacterium 32-64-14]
MRRRTGSSALGLAACVAIAALLPGAALACEARHRTLELDPGQNVGGSTAGYAALDLRDREVVLTFDDGPNPETTPRILDMLSKACVPATFFVLGEPAETYPLLVQRALADGHAVGGHTRSHTDLAEAPFSEATRDITSGFLPVAAAGAESNLFRFPQLSGTPQLLDWLREHGMAAVSADIDPRDWEGQAPAVTLARLKRQIREKGRGIIILHDDQLATVQLLPDLLAFLRSEGYSVVRLVGAPAHRQLASGETR